MKFRRFCAAVLTAVLVCGLCLPAAGASRSSFQDVTDEATAVNADVLRLMGVVSGVGDNSFMPDSTLSRAEFCVMVTNFIQRGDEVSRYAARTIFRDVTGAHWARGYINLMATATGDSPAMISGVGDGSFAPDQKVTVAQAITVLLRVLGYTGSETGFLWPESYMDCAKSIGLLDSISGGAHTVITRAQAAQLFVNALGCPQRGGQPYYTSLGSVTDDVILLAANVSADDGTPGAVRTSLNGESFLPASGSCTPYALQGKRGALVLNDQKEIVAFYPDHSNCVTVTLSGSAQPSYLTGSDGTRYTVSSSTLLYTPDSAQGKHYIEGYSALRAGTQVTLFTKSGKITAIYAAGSADSALGAVVASQSVSAADFSRLTGGSTGYSISKAGQIISMNEIQPYDVVTYDPFSGTLVVSDLRVTCTYVDAAPTPKAPQTITAMGTTFEVLDSAWDNMDNVKIGDTITLLLTADGKVAAIKKPAQSIRATAIGMAGESSVDVFLPNGATMKLGSGFSKNDSYNGKIVTVTNCDAKGRLSVTPIADKSETGSLDPSAMTLGSLKLCAGVRVFDQVRSSISVSVDLNSLTEAVPAARIKNYHTNNSGYVDCIVLDDYTGNAYSYGICRSETDESEEQYLSFENGVDVGFTKVQSPISVRYEQFSAVAVGSDGIPKRIIALDRLKDISPADFFEFQGSIYLEHNGTNYLVSDDVVCYKQANKLWFTNETGSERLAACKAFSDKLSAYYDPFSKQIRIVTAE